MDTPSNKLIHELKQASKTAVEMEDFASASVIEALLGALQQGDENILAQGVGAIVLFSLIPRQEAKQIAKAKLN
jgi:hypothetical protein